MYKIRYSEKLSVLDASRERIINLFKNNSKIYLSMSGGKDSMVLNDIVYRLALEGKIDVSKLIVVFIDEEIVVDEVIETAKIFRKRWLEVGARFEWWCVETVIFSCVDTLMSEERFIIWDRNQQERWCHEMPDYALTDHPLLKKRYENYQSFLQKRCGDGIIVVGLRIAESYQRRNAIASLRSSNKRESRYEYPMYDWEDSDIWLYILKYELKYPSISVYEDMWRWGASKQRLRLAPMTSSDVFSYIPILMNTRPDFYRRLEKRVPNVYMAYLYFDTAMFRGANKKKVGRAEAKDPHFYRNATLKALSEEPTAPTPQLLSTRRNAKLIILKYGELFDEVCWKRAYNMVMGGDPKRREYRALMGKIGLAPMKELKKKGEIDRGKRYKKLT